MPGDRRFLALSARAAVRFACALVVAGIFSTISAHAQGPGQSLGGMSSPGMAPPPPPKSKAGAPDFETDGPRFGPTGPQVLVAGVRITGNDAVTEAKVQSYLKTIRDRQFDPEVVQADVRRLTQSGLFRDVRTYTQQTAEGVVVTFEVFERPTIRYLKFVGNRELTDKVLKKQSGLKEGDALNIYEVEEGRAKLEEHYRTKGYPKATVSVLEGDKPRDRGVVYLVTEGFLEKVWSVNFVGNTIASDSRLKTQIQMKPGYLFSLIGGKVDRKKIDEDVERLTAYYRGLGFFSAKIGREFTYDESGQWLSLSYIIHEGPRYTIRNVAVVGNRKFESGQLTNVLGLKSGDWFNQSVMARDVQALLDVYGSQGHVFADIKPDPRFLEEPGQLDLVYTIQEGEQWRVGKINVHIAGENPHTRQNVVLNRISLRPGDVIDLRELRDSERRLKASQLFTNEPAQGVTPEIKVRPPGFDDPALAEGGGPGKQKKFRGQSPDSGVARPGERYTDLDVILPRNYR
jgi:outer membrane protein insertion porin family